jgi:hypothetical protein
VLIGAIVFAIACPLGKHLRRPLALMWIVLAPKRYEHHVLAARSLPRARTAFAASLSAASDVVEA